MKGIYLTQESKQEIEARIAELEQNQKDTKTDFEWNESVIEKNVYKTILSSAIILPVEESWEEIFNIHGMSKVITNFISIYPQGVIIQPKQ